MLRAGLTQTFAAFGVGLFRLHWALTVAAFMSFSMSFTVLQIVAFELGGDNSSVALAMAGNGIAWFVIGPYAGALADRLRKRSLLVIAQTVIAINFAVLGLLVVTDQIQVIWLTVSNFLMGASFAFTGPTRRAYVGDLLPPRLVGNGVALLQTGLTFPMSVGPLLASVLLAISFVGAGGAYFAMAGLLTITVVSLWLMPPGTPRDVRRGSVTREIVLGLRYAWRHPRVRVLLVALVLVSVAAGPYQALLPGLLENELGIDAKELGLVTWPMGVGSFVVGLSVAGVVATKWSGRVMFAAGIGFGLGVGPAGSDARPVVDAAHRLPDRRRLQRLPDPQHSGGDSPVGAGVSRSNHVAHLRPIRDSVDGGSGHGSSGGSVRGAPDPGLDGDHGRRDCDCLWDDLPADARRPGAGQRGGGGAGRAAPGAASDRGDHAPPEIVAALALPSHWSYPRRLQPAAEPGRHAVVVLPLQVRMADPQHQVRTAREADEFDPPAQVAQDGEVLFALRKSGRGGRPRRAESGPARARWRRA